METAYLLLTFVRNDGRQLQMGCGCPIKVAKISGIESPDYSVHTASSAVEPGSYVAGKKVEEREISVTFGVDDWQNRELYRAQIVSFFNPTKSYTLRLNWCYKQVQIGCELQGFKFSEIESMWGILEGKLDLLCPYPYWSDLDNFGKNIAAITAQWAWPVSFAALKSTHHEAGKIYGFKTFKNEVNLPNKGDVPTGIVIQFTAARGAVKNPKITKLSTGEYLRVIVDMQKGDILTIDTNKGRKGVRLNGEVISRKLEKLSTYFSIDGSDNIIQYDADENYTNLDVYLYYQSKYLGV